jgi:tetratricopeptide (TPR) repeat protein
VSNESRERENGYRAFISYSHRDDAAAKSLHKRLETYRLPKKLIGQIGERGPIPERLTPIFRDLDELSAADDLTVEIKAALARSATLIVLCSPGAKASKWVNLEIETFRALHGNTRPVLAALIEGEPADAFPSALTADGHEPVAADFRKSRDGKRLALLKLVAGMAGAPLDALVQRDAQRQLRRVTAITVSALTAVVAMALLLAVALRAQSEAERQRQEAEGLVEYMLTDLRDKLKGVGRLDVMTAVNERAMQYYGGQEALEGLPAESLERRARVLHAMGEDDDLQGDLGLALKKFEEARRATAAVLAQKPDNPEAIFSHAQSEYWVGYAHQKRGDYQGAIAKYQAKLVLLERYKERRSDYTKADIEIAWTNNALGVVYLNGLSDPATSLKFFSNYQEIFSHLVDKKPIDTKLLYSLADAHAWLADAHLAMNNIDLAKVDRLKQSALLDRLLKTDPSNQSYIWSRVGADRAIFKICYRTKKNQCARDSIEKAEYRLKSTDYDRKNLEWLWLSIYINLDSAFLEVRLGNQFRAKQRLKNGKTYFDIYRENNIQNPENIKQIKETIEIISNMLAN